jgi:hypothetical protein
MSKGDLRVPPARIKVPAAVAPRGARRFETIDPRISERRQLSPAVASAY